MDEMYGQRKKLESIFYFFDVNGDGVSNLLRDSYHYCSSHVSTLLDKVISREEFLNGCGLLNKSLHPDCQLTQIEHTLDLMDFDGSGTIDMNEFFEVVCFSYLFLVPPLLLHIFRLFVFWTPKMGKWTAFSQLLPIIRPVEYKILFLSVYESVLEANSTVKQ